MPANKSSQVKVALGAIAMTSLAALTPPADAKTLDSSQSFQNLLRQANLSLDNQNQQMGEQSAYSSFQEADGSFKTAVPFTCCIRPWSCCNTRETDTSETDISFNSDDRTSVTAHYDQLDTQPKTGGCFSNTVQ